MDPISAWSPARRPPFPFLFNIIVDVLQQMLLHASREGILLHPLVDDITCPILQYADDTLIIIRDIPGHVANLKCILDEFSTATGLTINFHKSTFVPIKTDPDTALTIANTFGYAISSFPQTYLGLPLSTYKMSFADFAPIINKTGMRISGWRGRCLPIGGRLILVNSVLTAMLAHAMSVGLLPAGVVEAIDKRRRAFLWTGEETYNEGSFKVAWDDVCVPKKLGGLGVLSIQSQNSALLGKFLSKLHSDTAAPGPAGFGAYTWIRGVRIRSDGTFKIFDIINRKQHNGSSECGDSDDEAFGDDWYRRDKLKIKIKYLWYYFFMDTYLQLSDRFNFAIHVPPGTPATSTEGIVIMMYHMLQGRTGMVFCRPGDPAWTRIANPNSQYLSFTDFAYFDGKMFALDDKGVTLVFDATTLQLLHQVDLPPDTPNVTSKIFDYDLDDFHCLRLIALPSKVLLVKTRVKSGKPEGFDVFELSSGSGEDEGGQAWRKVNGDNIGGSHELFLDCYHGTFRDAHDDKGTRIYFHDDFMAPVGSGAAYCYNMQDDKLECVYMPPEDKGSIYSTRPSCTWEMDPISAWSPARRPPFPFLFNIIVDVLQQMLLHASREGILLHPLVDDITCPILQYADDTLIIIRDIPGHVANLKCILDEFSTATGLTINFHKSTFVPIKTDPDTALTIANTFGYAISSFPQTYLGLPLSTYKMSFADFAPIINKTGMRISGWRGRCLPIGGRLILVNSVLTAMLAHAMSVGLLPAGDVEAIDKRRRAFL
ncbi:hypothetical protein QYE76_038338 [Lolium multiflorum]|uniref:Reverse transcriptase domain-containing protein n=1 Tax=Lolium multiflorum TaxID=4521 RepID=A0AAD8WR61_LOLMU|nr:hypothetical protein QYE76_038338 [Lolium multiflorum]